MSKWEIRQVVNGGDQTVIGECDTEEQAIAFVNGHSAKAFDGEPQFGDVIVFEGGFSYRRFKTYWGEYMVYDKAEFEKLPRAID